jgi:hypothetical protein
MGRLTASVVTALAVTLSAVPASTADDLATLTHDVASGQDFRLRVGAALSLGKTKSRAALGPLVGALDDTHPAVRAAAAAALGVLGNRDGIEPLRSHLAGEPSAPVRSQIKAAIDKLQTGREPGEAAARVLVKLGQLKNVGAARGQDLVDFFRGATRAKASQLPGVEVLADASEGQREAEARKLPLLVLDGSVKVAHGSTGEQVTVSAEVAFVFRRVPEHALTGSVTGTARARDNAKILQDQVMLAQLESRALQGAVESAMSRAPELMELALR